jgi:nucleobase:cation symporter-1, NCS1 family
MDTSTAAERDVEHKLQPIPAWARTSRPIDQVWIWAGAEIKPVQWILGAIGIAIGLSLRDTLLVLIAGNIIGMAIFALLAYMGQRTGVTQMVITRSAFGRVGARIPSMIQALVALGWCALNTWVVLDLGVALLGKFGVTGSTGLKVVLVLAIMALQVGIAAVGIKAITVFEKWTVPLTIVVLIAMTIVAWTRLPVDWSYAGAGLTGVHRISAMSTVMGAVGIGNGISWYAYASDYSRFVAPGVPARRLAVFNFVGMITPVIWLGTLGATLATVSKTTDPGQLIVNSYGALAIPILLLVLHAPVATNIVNIYSSSLALQTADLKLNRRVVTWGIGLIASILTLWFIANGTLGATLTNWLVGLVIWITPWAAIICVDYFLLRRRDVDVDALYTYRAGGHHGINPRALIAWVLGIVAAWACGYGIPAALQGPIAAAMGGVNLSWLAGPLVAGGLFWLLETVSRSRRAEPAAAEVPAA